MATRGNNIAAHLGDLTKTAYRESIRILTCKDAGCKGEVVGRGLCSGHYQRFHRHYKNLWDHYASYLQDQERWVRARQTRSGQEEFWEHVEERACIQALKEMDWRPIGTERQCEMDGCKRKHYARGMCQTHYNQTRSLRKDDTRSKRPKRARERLNVAEEQHPVIELRELVEETRREVERLSKHVADLVNDKVNRDGAGKKYQAWDRRGIDTTEIAKAQHQKGARNR